MLPGFRFLFAAIVFSMSLLVFGLGAAALLRAAHEEFASTPSWRAAPETMFAQQSETVPPTLAMLRVDMPAAEPKPPDDVAAAAPAAPAAPPEVVPTPPPPEKIALTADDAPPQQTATPEIPAAETAAPVAAPAPTAAPASADETRITAAPEVPAANEAAPADASEQATAPAATDADIASTKIATLGGPPVAIAPQRPKTAGAEPDKSVAKKRQEARRAVQHRRMAARAQQPPQQPVDPFASAVAPAGRR